MNHQRTPRLKLLLERVLPGFMVDAAWLKRQGIDPKSIHDYVQRGWLERVVRGVYRRPLAGQVPSASVADWQFPLLSIQWIMGYDVHLGGPSALAWHGLSHYLMLGDESHVCLYGTVPAWLARLPVNVQFIVRSRALFGDGLAGVENAEHQLDTVPGPESGAGPMVSPWRWPLKVSSPERAILEALDELPGHASFHNLDMVFQGLSNLRPRQLMSLLQACRSIKVRRLFFVFADRHELAWLKYLDREAIDFGSGPRALVKGGKLHPTYRIYVPEAFLPANVTAGASHA